MVHVTSRRARFQRATSSIFAAASLVVLAACGEDEASPTGPGGGTQEPALNEVVTSPALNASSSDTLVYFSFATGGLVPRTGDWDIALRRFELRLNSPAIAGASSKNVLGYAVNNNRDATDAEVQAFTPANQLAAFDNLRAAQIPAAEQFTTDRLTENPQAHLIFGGAPRANTALYWKVRLANGAFGLFRVTAINYTPQFQVASLELESRLQTGSTLGPVQAFTITPNGAVTSISLVTGAAVTPDGCNWDLQFNPSASALSIAVNTACNVGTYPGPTSPTFAAATSASDAPQYGAYLSQLVGPIASSTTDPGAPFRYNLANTMRLHPTFNIYLVKTGTRVYKVQVIDYYNQTGTAGFPTLRYARIQ
jgi:hypothetical protein